MLLDAQPCANWFKGSLDLVTRQASTIAEYIHNQEKHKQCVALLERRAEHAGLTLMLYKSVEQGDEKSVRALLAQVSIAEIVSDKGDSGELMRHQLIALASQDSRNLRVLTLLQAFLKVNTYKSLQVLVTVHRPVQPSPGPDDQRRGQGTRLGPAPQALRGLLRPGAVNGQGDRD